MTDKARKARVPFNALVYSNGWAAAYDQTGKRVDVWSPREIRGFWRYRNMVRVELTEKYVDVKPNYTRFPERWKDESSA